jgi:hypothetical protein
VQYPALIDTSLTRSHPQLPRVLANGVLDLPFGAHANVSLSSGKVAAFLAYAGYDRKNDVATYALRILNDSACEVRAELSCVLKDGTLRAASPLVFKVPPFSMRDDHVPVRLDVIGRFERAIIEVRSDETCFSIEAPAPQFPAPKWIRWTLIPFVPLVLAGATGFIAPRVAPLDAPERVFAGSTMAIPYEASGYGSVEYSLTNRNRVQLYAGIASTPSGVLHFALPPRPGDSPYTVHVRMSSPFGFSERVATISAVAAPAKPQAKPVDVRPLIDELRVEPSPVHAGGTLTVSYGARATSGDISLVDALGATWASAPFSAAGTSVMHVPPAAAGRTMRVVLHVHRGAQEAQSSVEAMVLAAHEIDPAIATNKPAEDTPAASAPPAAFSIDLSSTVVSGGDTVTVRVHGGRDNVRIKLVDATGATVAEGDGSSGMLSLAAPVVQTPSRFYVVATVNQGVSEQSALKTLTVTPR